MKTFEIAAGILAASALAACAFQPSEADKYGADESAITAEAYVSSSRGDDANDGSRDRPFKTFAKIPKKDARIFLRKGDVFYEPLSGLENCVVDSYGRGSPWSAA